MKMKLFLASVVGLMLCACDPDDETPKNPETSKTDQIQQTDPTPNQSTSTDKQVSDILGTWMWEENEGSYHFWESYTFKDDNTFTCTGAEMGNTFSSSGKYIYAASKHELTLIDEHATEKEGIHTYTVILDGNSLTLVQENGEKCGPYIKQ